jgi:hypothetical protein
VSALSASFAAHFPAAEGEIQHGLFRRFPSIGRVGPAKFHFPERPRSSNPLNIAVMAELAAELGFPPVTSGSGVEFVGGTMFFERRAVLECAFAGRDLRRLTEPMTVGAPPSDDGVFEHGWERFLGLMVQACGFEIQGTGTLVRDASGVVRLDPQNRWNAWGYVPVPVRHDIVKHRPDSSPPSRSPCFSLPPSALHYLENYVCNIVSECRTDGWKAKNDHDSSISSFSFVFV